MASDMYNSYGLLKEKIHPVVKLLAIFLTAMLILLAPGISGDIKIYAIWLGVLISFWFISKPIMKLNVAPLKYGLLLCLILIISQGFLYKSSETITPVLTLFRYNIGGNNMGMLTLEGLIAGLVGSIKIMCILVSAQILVSTTSIEGIMYCLSILRIPKNTITVLITGLRFVPSVAARWAEILDARKLQGFNPQQFWIIKRLLVVYPRLIVPLVLSILRTGLYIDISMETRGYNLPTRRTIYHFVPAKPSDYLISLILFLLFLVLVINLF